MDLKKVISSAAISALSIAAIYIIFALVLPSSILIVGWLITWIVLIYFGYKGVKKKGMSSIEAATAGAIANVAGYAILILLSVIFLLTLSGEQAPEILPMFSIFFIVSLSPFAPDISGGFIVLAILVVAMLIFSLALIGAFLSYIGAFIGKRF